MEASISTSPRGFSLSRLSAWAGILFSLSWVVGLSVWSSTTDVTQTGEDLLRQYTGNEAIALVQFFFTEGLPAITLAIVMISLAKYARAFGESTLGKAILASSLAAAAISLAQFTLGAIVCLVTVPAKDGAATKMVIDTLSRIDGVKMLFMTVFAIASFGVIRNGKARLPRWLSWIALALAVTIFLSGLGFLFLIDSLSLAAYASLPLLMLWITAVGVVVAKK
jgi:hypothetical protein